MTSRISSKPPSYRPAEDARGKDTISGMIRSSCSPTARVGSFVPSGLKDGPLPTHYEPQESLITIRFTGSNAIPAAWNGCGAEDNPYHRPYDDPRFPYLLTTYRLTEHHTAGGMSRWLSWLPNCSRRCFCEVSPELASEVGLKNGGWATIRTRARRN